MGQHSPATFFVKGAASASNGRQRCIYHLGVIVHQSIPISGFKDLEFYCENLLSS